MSGLVHENKDFCGRENKIVASAHEMCRLGGHDGQFEVSALEKGHSDGQPLTEIDSRGWTKGTKQRSEPFGAARAACFELLAGVFASRVACRPSIQSHNHGMSRKSAFFLDAED